MVERAGSHGFSGSWEPRHQHSVLSETFSYGVFEWLLKSSGKGCKKSAVKVRVSGSVHRADEVKAMAENIAGELDAGTYKGPRNVKVTFKNTVIG